MAYRIGEYCIACGECEPHCPVGAITFGERIYVIDPEKCIGCGSCADNCTFGSVFED